MSHTPYHGDIILEFTAIGSYVKVTAVDVNTGVEASISSAKNVSKEDMKQHAIRRLHYVMKKKGLIADDSSNNTKNGNNDLIV